MAEKISFYFDEHMPRAVEKELLQREIYVTMAVDVDMVGKDDDTEHLRYATEHQRVVVTRDFAFAGRTAKRDDHTGLICWTGAADDFGGMIRVLTKFVADHTIDDIKGNVFWLK